MSVDRLLRVLLLSVVASGMVSCGSEGSGGDGGAARDQPGGGSSQERPSPDTSARGVRTCGPIPVPGHEGTDVRAQGADCAQARELVAAAVGRGRQAYRAAGFACEPSPAGGGDTNYACTADGARVTFRYGAA